MKLYIQASAADDILRQVEHYAEQGLPSIAQRFAQSVKTSIGALLTRPHIGALKATANPKLTSLRTWPVTDFDDFQIYYILKDDTLQVIRILHGKRDIRPIIEQQDVGDPYRHDD